MKKILAILLACCMILALAACGGTAVSDAAASEAQSAQASAEAAEEAAEPAAEPEAAAAAEAEASAEPEASAEEPAEVEAQNFEIPMPLTEEPVTFTFFMRFNPQVQDWCQDMSDNLFYNTLEELSNVHIDFKLFHPMNFGEQFNLTVVISKHGIG